MNGNVFGWVLSYDIKNNYCELIITVDRTPDFVQHEHHHIDGLLNAYTSSVFKTRLFWQKGRKSDAYSGLWRGRPRGKGRGRGQPRGRGRLRGRISDDRDSDSGYESSGETKYNFKSKGGRTHAVLDRRNNFGISYDSKGPLPPKGKSEISS